MESENRGSIRTLSGINFILGIWLIISPWIFSYSTSQARWMSFVFGIVVLILGAIRYIAPTQSWASALNGLVGLWLIVAPFVLSYAKTSSYWNEVIVGIIVAILAFSNAGTVVHHTGRHHGSPA